LFYTNEYIKTVTKYIREHCISVRHFLQEADEPHDVSVLYIQTRQHGVEESLEFLVGCSCVLINNHVEELVKVGFQDVELPTGVKSAHLGIPQVYGVRAIRVSYLRPDTSLDFRIGKASETEGAAILCQVRFIVSKRSLQKLHLSLHTEMLRFEKKTQDRVLVSRLQIIKMLASRQSNLGLLEPSEGRAEAGL